MEYLKITIIALLIVLLTFNLVICQLSFFIQATAIQPSFYNGILEKHGLYSQLHMFVVKLVRESFRLEQQDLVYLEQAMSEAWLKTEVVDISNEVYKFLTGQRDDFPAVPVYRLKDRVNNAIDHSLATESKEQLISYRFSSLADNIRLSYFTPMTPIWKLRGVLEYRILINGILTILLFLFFGLLWLTTFSVKESVLWFGTSLMASSIIVIGVGLLASWFVGQSTASLSFIDELVRYGFPKQGSEMLFKALSNGIGFRINGLAAFFLLAGSIMTY